MGDLVAAAISTIPPHHLESNNLKKLANQQIITLAH